MWNLSSYSYYYLFPQTFLSAEAFGCLGLILKAHLFIYLLKKIHGGFLISGPIQTFIERTPEGFGGWNKVDGEGGNDGVFTFDLYQIILAGKVHGV